MPPLAEKQKIRKRQVRRKVGVVGWPRSRGAAGRGGGRVVCQTRLLRGVAPAQPGTAPRTTGCEPIDKAVSSPAGPGGAELGGQLRRQSPVSCGIRYQQVRRDHTGGPLRRQNPPVRSHVSRQQQLERAVGPAAGGAHAPRPRGGHHRHRPPQPAPLHREPAVRRRAGQRLGPGAARVGALRRPVRGAEQPAGQRLAERGARRPAALAAPRRPLPDAAAVRGPRLQDRLQRTALLRVPPPHAVPAGDPRQRGGQRHHPQRDRHPGRGRRAADPQPARSVLSEHWIPVPRALHPRERLRAAQRLQVRRQPRHGPVRGLQRRRPARLHAALRGAGGAQLGAARWLGERSADPAVPSARRPALRDHDPGGGVLLQGGLQRRAPHRLAPPPPLPAPEPHPRGRHRAAAARQRGGAAPRGRLRAAAAPTLLPVPLRRPPPLPQPLPHHLLSGSMLAWGVGRPVEPRRAAGLPTPRIAGAVPRRALALTSKQVVTN